MSSADPRRWPDRPDHRFLDRVAGVCREVRVPWAGGAEALGALVRPPASGPATDVLREQGLTWERWRARHPRPDVTEESEQLTFTPTWYGLIGFAQGMALAAGERDLADEHVLLALAYNRDTRSPGWLDHFEVDAGAVVAALARRGVAVPELLPPAPARRARGVGARVYFPPAEGDAVTRALFRRYPPGGGYWGFNIEPGDGRHYVEGEADLDIETTVREAVADPATVVVEPRA